jgi:hypothetical protein
MPWEPGKSGNPNGYKGQRDRNRRAVFERLKELGHKDPLEILGTIANDEKEDPGIRVAAASAQVPYLHPKLQSIPVPRFITLEIEIPEFAHVSEAEAFLIKIAALVAGGQLDVLSGQEIHALIKTWIDVQYAKDELQFKINPPEQRDVQIHITGGLSNGQVNLPGTDIIQPPLLNGHAVSEQLLSAPTDVVPGTNPARETTPTEFSPAELKASGPHPLQGRHFRPGDAPQSRSDEPGMNSANGQGQGTQDHGPEDGGSV